MEMQWLDRWRLQVWHLVRHPWHSLVSLLGSVGDLILWVMHFVARAALWLWRQLRRLANIPLWGLVKGLAYGVLGLCVLGFLLTMFLINYPATKVPDFQPVDQHVYLSQGWG